MLLWLTVLHHLTILSQKYGLVQQVQSNRNSKKAIIVNPGHVRIRVFYLQYGAVQSLLFHVRCSSVVAAEVCCAYTCKLLVVSEKKMILRGHQMRSIKPKYGFYLPLGCPLVIRWEVNITTKMVWNILYI